MIIENKQLKLLENLAAKLKSEAFDRETVVDSLIQAKILTKKENFTKQYSNLAKAIKAETKFTNARLIPVSSKPSSRP